MQFLVTLLGGGGRGGEFLWVMPAYDKKKKTNDIMTTWYAPLMPTSCWFRTSLFPEGPCQRKLIIIIINYLHTGKPPTARQTLLQHPPSPPTPNTRPYLSLLRLLYPEKNPVPFNFADPQRIIMHFGLFPFKTIQK